MNHKISSIIAAHDSFTKEHNNISLSTLSRRCELGPIATRKLINGLVEKNFLAKVRRDGRSYRVIEGERWIEFTKAVQVLKRIIK